MKNLRAWTIVALCGVLGALTACSSGSSFVKPGYDFNSVGKVAVVVTMRVGNPAEQQEVADLFAMQILRKGYDVIDRANLPELEREVAFQNTSGITSPEGRAKLAIHNVAAVVVVNLAMPVSGNWRAYYGYSDEDGQEISLTAKLLDVRTGTLLWSGEGSGYLDSALPAFGGALLGAGAGAVAGSAIGKTPGAIIGGIAGALAGGTVGAALAPDMAQLMRSVIEKTCRGLPAAAVKRQP